MIETLREGSTPIYLARATGFRPPKWLDDWYIQKFVEWFKTGRAKKGIVCRGVNLDNRATVRIYWGVIGLISDWLGCSVEDLAIVVLTHELAHAYTQLGADIEGRRWAARSFAKAETALKEGLAQYYTHRVLHRLDRRHGGALKVFLGLLPGQADVYRVHQPWVEGSSPEAIRRAMLEVRRWNEAGLAHFNRRLESAQKELGPKA